MERDAAGRRGARGVYGAVAVFLAVAVPVLFIEACGGTSSRSPTPRRSARCAASPATTPTTTSPPRQRRRARGEPARRAARQGDAGEARCRSRRRPVGHDAVPDRRRRDGRAPAASAGEFAPDARRALHLLRERRAARSAPTAASTRATRAASSTTATARRHASSASCTSRSARRCRRDSPGPNDHWHRHSQPLHPVRPRAGRLHRGAVRARPRRHARAVRRACTARS